MNNIIDTVIIPAAGAGKRIKEQLDITYSKEMILVNNKPCIRYIIDEAIASGIKNIIVIVHESKKDLITYLNSLKLDINLTISFQNTQNGIAKAIYSAKQYINTNYFGVMLGDDVFTPSKIVFKQLLKLFNKNNQNVIGVLEIADVNLIKKYSSMKIESLVGNTFKILDIIEKPQEDEIYSMYASQGRYIFSKNIFSVIEKQNTGINNEFQLTDSIRLLLKEEPCAGLILDGIHYDFGSIDGLKQALRNRINFNIKK
ncbi:MAG: NTP transferase domain-containing protein [Acholeplasmatales bacterium]|jgi:UTP--glucose-1-phosphate uridylyltransferase|nr:NTP transferase domain-containing protein [Acholeplasmatales bacterium]